MHSASLERHSGPPPLVQAVLLNSNLNLSMTMRFFIHSIAKRAEALTLVNSGATENFISLPYAQWLKLPIKRLAQPRKLYNVNGTQNKSGELQFYTNLSVQTGTNHTLLCFFLTNLGEQKAIFGYPWFTAVQPKIDWRRGWIDHTQLPIILRAPNAQKATFGSCKPNFPKKLTNDCYFIGKVTIGNTISSDTPTLPPEYQQHRKIFSEAESQRLSNHTIWDHTIELLPNAPPTLPGCLLFFFFFFLNSCLLSLAC